MLSLALATLTHTQLLFYWPIFHACYILRRVCQRSSYRNLGIATAKISTAHMLFPMQMGKKKLIGHYPYLQHTSLSTRSYKKKIKSATIFDVHTNLQDVQNVPSYTTQVNNTVFQFFI